jgi:xylulokinase
VFGAARYEALTGLPPSFLWTLGKLLLLRRADPAVWGGTARFALLHDFVLRAFGAGDLYCDLSNASLTGLLDLRALDWSDEILAAAGLDRARLPTLVRPGQRVGAVSREAARRSGLREGTWLVAGGGDQQCAALGQGAVEPGDAGLCLGTAAVVSCPVDAPLTGTGGRFFCTVHAAPGRWVIEGLLNSVGSALDWAARALGLDGVAALEAEASGASSEGAFFLPHLSGVGSPDHRAAARGAWVGLDLGCTRARLARAAFEGVAHETGRILDAMEERGPIRQLVLSGGGAAGQLLPRLLADLSGRRLVLREHHEATLAGAALLAWCGAGRFADPLEAARTLGRQGCARMVEPAGEPAERLAARARYLAWVRAFLAQADTNGGAP